MKPFQKITEETNKFRDKLGWKEYHRKYPKDLAMAIMTESAEIAEHFRFRNGEVLETHMRDQKDQIGDEIVSTIMACIALADDLGVDLDTHYSETLDKIYMLFKEHPKDLDTIRK